MLWLTLSLLANASEEDSLIGLRALRQGSWRSAYGHLRRALDANPDDLETQGQLASAEARGGRFGDAVAQFEQGPFGNWYEKIGIIDHANALRELGRGKEAAELRRHAMLHPERHGLVSELAAVDDLRVGGELELALEAAEEAVGQYPKKPSAHAWLAHVHLDMGNVDEAEAELWLAHRRGDWTARGHLLDAQMAMGRGELEYARETLMDLAIRRPDSFDILALRVELEWMDRDCLAVREIAERPRWAVHQHPDVLAIHAACLDETGETRRATETRWRLDDFYPDHPGPPPRP